MNLRLELRHPEVRTIDAIRAIHRRGVDLLVAKRAVETLLGQVDVYLPPGDNEALIAELAAAGITGTIK